MIKRMVLLFAMLLLTTSSFSFDAGVRDDGIYYIEDIMEYDYFNEQYVFFNSIHHDSDYHMKVDETYVCNNHYYDESYDLMDSPVETGIYVLFRQESWTKFHNIISENHTSRFIMLNAQQSATYYSHDLGIAGRVYNIDEIVIENNQMNIGALLPLYLMFKRFRTRIMFYSSGFV